VDKGLEGDGLRVTQADQVRAQTDIPLIHVGYNRLQEPARLSPQEKVPSFLRLFPGRGGNVLCEPVPRVLLIIRLYHRCLVSSG